MEVDCEGCAGCCIDWRPLVDAPLDHERRGPHAPIDDAYNLVALTREEVRRFVDAGLGDVMTPRLWRSPEGPPDPDRSRAGTGVTIDGIDLAGLGGQPAFFVGLRTAPKPVAPFGRESETWLATCAFLDPATLQCRIHDDEVYPGECRDYPGHNLALDVETECERVERHHGGERLIDDDPPDGEGLGGLLLGPQALGAKVFVHPEPERLSGTVERLAAREATPADRAEFVAVAAAASPGTTAISESRYEDVRERVLAQHSWAGRAIAEWEERAGATDEAAIGRQAPDATLAREVEEDRGAPPTPGWE